MFEKIITKPKSINILHYTAAALLPNIALFFLYAANVQETFMRLDHVLILAAMLSAVGVVAFIILRLLSKSIYISLILSVIAWVFFWSFVNISNLLGIIYGRNRLVFLIAFLLIILAIAFIARFIKFNLERFSVIFAGVAGVICLLFAFNFANSLRLGGISLANPAGEGARTFYHVKQDFNVDYGLPRPDIYWLWMDGKLSFDTVERFFGDEQDDLRNQLALRGFVIDDGAMLNAGRSWIATLALFFPSFYDNYFGEILESTARDIIYTERRSYMYARTDADIGHLPVRVHPYTELFHALKAAGYTTVQQAHPSHCFTPHATNIFYDIRYNAGLVGENLHSSPRFPFLTGVEDLMDLMTTTTPFAVAWRALMHFNSTIDWRPIPAHTDRVRPYFANHNYPEAFAHEDMLLRALVDTFEIPSPKFVITTPFFTHRTSWNWFHPQGGAPSNPFADDGYITSHRYSAAAMLNMIDIILANNPYAVIILQSDHGFHTEDVHTALRQIGTNDYDLFELVHSTLSAVRIPERYGGLDTPIAPSNIARELVNRFVGHNYEMTAPHTNPFAR